jgi:hypothetical protein
MQTLSGRRGYNEAGIQPLQMSELILYIERQEISLSQKEHALNVFTTLDDIIVDDYFKKRENE